MCWWGMLWCVLIIKSRWSCVLNWVKCVVDIMQDKCVDLLEMSSVIFSITLINSRLSRVQWRDSSGKIREKVFHRAWHFSAHIFTSHGRTCIMCLNPSLIGPGWGGNLKSIFNKKERHFRIWSKKTLEEHTSKYNMATENTDVRKSEGWNSLGLGLQALGMVLALGLLLLRFSVRTVNASVNTTKLI